MIKAEQLLTPLPFEKSQSKIYAYSVKPSEKEDFCLNLDIERKALTKVSCVRSAASE